MTASMSQIREGLATRLRTIPHLNVSPYMLPKPEMPAACVLPHNAEFDRTMSSDDTDYYFDLWAYCSATELVQSQKNIDEYMAPSGARSFRQAIDADTTLGGTVACCYVTGWSNYGVLVDVGGIQALGATMQIKVEA